MLCWLHRNERRAVHAHNSANYWRVDVLSIVGAVWHIAGMSTGKQSRIDVRSSPEFYDTLKGAAKRAQLSVSDYTRLAIAERMALDELGVARMSELRGTENG